LKEQVLRKYSQLKNFYYNNTTTFSFFKVVSEQAVDDAEEASEDMMKSPVKSPVNPAKPLFSFAKLDSPFG